MFCDHLCLYFSPSRSEQGSITVAIARAYEVGEFSHLLDVEACNEDKTNEAISWCGCWKFERRGESSGCNVAK
ncbi:hypothetical protein BGW80DRAFT_1400664 [Lactifluus volemus]|nr:hypothetical protein BGW80DRAFT_1400664 [Lactifluus volemus]